MSDETKNAPMLIDLPVVEQGADIRVDSVEDEKLALHGMKAWRSLDDLKQTDEFLHLNAGEFAPGAMNGLNTSADPTSGSRRDFMKILAASTAPQLGLKR